jgi:predicted RNase H-like HicB family nuclease
MSGEGRGFELEIQVASDPDDGGFVSQIVGHPGIMSQGESEREAVENAIDAFLCVASATLDVDIAHGRATDAGHVHTHRVTVPA